MKIKINTLLITLPIALSTGQSKASVKEFKCEGSGAQRVINCVLKNSPHLKADKEALKGSNYRVGKASQIPNPTIESEYHSGRSAGVSQSEFSIGYFHTFELGGKRSARKMLAKSKNNLLHAKFESDAISTLQSSVISLYRLAQIKHELHILDEARRTFRSIIKRYKKRKKLTPNQESSVALFSLAENDYLVSINSAKSESLELSTTLSYLSSLSQQEILKSLPKESYNWPDSKTLNTQISISSHLKVKEQRLETSKQNLQKEKSHAWPDLLVGPVYKTSSEGGTSANSIGISVSIPLPLYNSNSAGVNLALAEKSASEIRYLNSQRSAEMELNKQITRYKRFISTLSSTKSIEQMERDHKRIESLFERGLVDSALIIETHRQILDLTMLMHLL